MKSVAPDNGHCWSLADLVRRELDSLRGLDKLLEGLRLVANSLQHGGRWPQIHGRWDMHLGREDQLALCGLYSEYGPSVASGLLHHHLEELTTTSSHRARHKNGSDTSAERASHLPAGPRNRDLKPTWLQRRCLLPPLLHPALSLQQVSAQHPQWHPDRPLGEATPCPSCPPQRCRGWFPWGPS